LVDSRRADGLSLERALGSIRREFLLDLSSRFIPDVRRLPNSGLRSGSGAALLVYSSA
jgi:hypothetical protein